MEKIPIKCTSCGQKFSVTKSYLGKMVECGACDEKFKVEGAAIIKQRKHYPGEKAESNADMFAKSPSFSSEKQKDVAFQTANYQNLDKAYVQIKSPIKTFMMITGVILIFIVLTMFLLGGNEDGSLKDLDNSKRMVLAGFVALAGAGLIIAGSINKLKALLGAIVLGGSLAAMPFIFPEVKTVKTAPALSENIDSINIAKAETIQDAFDKELQNYKEGIGYSKVEAARIALNKPHALKALVLSNTKIQDQDTILTYLHYTLGLDALPVTYPYGREVDGEPP